MSQPPPGVDLERQLAASGFSRIAGVDEAGRGPLCGPVVAGAVIFPLWSSLPDALSGLDDSKRLTPACRERLAVVIRETALAVGVGLAEPAEIDHLNIRQAALLAMSRAVAVLSPPSGPPGGSRLSLPDFVLVDGRDLPDGLPCPGRPVVKGDRLSASIAAASILAKTHRDALMTQLALLYPGYGWEENAGYPTARHLRALETLGVTPVHRRTFRPVAALLAGSSCA